MGRDAGKIVDLMVENEEVPNWCLLFSQRNIIVLGRSLLYALQICLHPKLWWLKALVLIITQEERNKVWLWRADSHLAHVTSVFCLLSFYFHLVMCASFQTGKQRVGLKVKRWWDLNLNLLAWSAVLPHYNQEILEWPIQQEHIWREGAGCMVRKGGAHLPFLGSKWMVISFIHICAYIPINTCTFNLCNILFAL